MLIKDKLAELAKKVASMTAEQQKTVIKGLEKVVSKDNAGKESAGKE